MCAYKFVWVRVSVHAQVCVQVWTSELQSKIVVCGQEEHVNMCRSGWTQARDGTLCTCG